MKPKDDEKQRAIAEATFNLVAQTGLSGLTMADIARTAGIATSTLYVYYPSKGELISQLYEEAKTATMLRLMDGVVPGTPLRSRVRRIWGNLLRHRLERYAGWCSRSSTTTPPGSPRAIASCRPAWRPASWR